MFIEPERLMRPSMRSSEFSGGEPRRVNMLLVTTWVCILVLLALFWGVVVYFGASYLLSSSLNTIPVQLMAIR